MGLRLQLTIMFGGRIGVLAGIILSLTAGAASAQSSIRPEVGGFGQAPDAMIFYVAHGGPDACGAGCSDWIAAEGTVQFETHKRLIAILDRQAGRKLPVVIHAWGRSYFNVASGLGRILRDRGIDTMVGATEVDACDGASEADCFALKRPGGPLDARMNVSHPTCDLACVLILVGGVHRSLPPDTRIMLSGRTVASRLGLNISDEIRESLIEFHGDRLRLYLRQMGVEPELIDIVDSNSETRRISELPPSEWTRLRIIAAQE